MSRWMHVGELLDMAAYLYPDKMGAKDLYRSLTFKEWNERCNRLANGLMDLGLKKGDKIAIIAYNCLEWMEIYGALRQERPHRRAHHVPADSQRILLHPRQRRSQGLYRGKRLHRWRGLPARANFPSSRSNYIFFGAEKAPDGYIHYEDLIDGASPEARRSRSITRTPGSSCTPRGPPAGPRAWCDPTKASSPST